MLEFVASEFLSCMGSKVSGLTKPQTAWLYVAIVKSVIACWSDQVHKKCVHKFTRFSQLFCIFPWAHLFFLLRALKCIWLDSFLMILIVRWGLELPTILCCHVFLILWDSRNKPWGKQRPYKSAAAVHRPPAFAGSNSQKTLSRDRHAPPAMRAHSQSEELG